jgi:hypothetical protein
VASQFRHADAKKLREDDTAAKLPVQTTKGVIVLACPDMFGMLNASMLAATAPKVVKKALPAPAAIGD